MTDIVTCSSCGEQYIASATSCVECGAPLVSGPILAPSDDEVGYDLSDWSDADRRDLADSLASEGIACRWEATEIVVREEDADRVEALIDEIDNPDALDVDETDDDAGGELLSALYVAADVLQHDPKSTVAVIELLEAADQASELGPPYGVDGDVWRDVHRRIDALADAIGQEADEETVMAAARALREAVRPLV